MLDHEFLFLNGALTCFSHPPEAEEMHLAAGQTDTAPKGKPPSLTTRHTVSAPIGVSPDEVGPEGGFPHLQ